MTTSKVLKALSDQREKPAYDSRLPCKVCGKATLWETLSEYGERCFPCFKDYCRDGFQPKPRSRAAERIRAEIAAIGKKLPA